MVRGDDVGLPKRGLLECLCSHSSSRSSLAASAPHLHSLQGFGIYFSYFLTVASWVRFIISWTGRKKPHGAGVMEGEHAPAELAFICASACLRSPTAPGRPEVSRDTWAGAAQQGASAGSQATWLTLSMSSKGAGRLLGPAGGLPCSRDPRHWLRHWGNQFTRKLTRMRRWVGLLFAPSHRPSGQSWPGLPQAPLGALGVLLPPGVKEGGLVEIGLILHIPLSKPQFSPLERGQTSALFFLCLGAHPHPHFMDDIAEAQSEGIRSGPKEAESGQGLDELCCCCLLLSGTLGCTAFSGDGESTQEQLRSHTMSCSRE